MDVRSTVCDSVNLHADVVNGFVSRILGPIISSTASNTVVPNLPAEQRRQQQELMRQERGAVQRDVDVNQDGNYVRVVHCAAVPFDLQSSVFTISIGSSKYQQCWFSEHVQCRANEGWLKLWRGDRLHIFGLTRFACAGTTSPRRKNSSSHGTRLRARRSHRGTPRCRQ